MQTSWHGVFDMDPGDTIQVRVGDLQEFLRQQMMGVPNPGITVATADERKDNLSALAQRLRDCKHREFNDGMDVEYAIEEAIGYNGGSIDGLFDRLADLVESSEATQPEHDGETFCTIRWMRDDVLSAINRSADVSLAREGSHANEVEAIIDSVIDAIGDGLDESSTEHGWEVIYQLIPNEAIEKAKELDPLPAPGKEQLDVTTGQEGLGTSYRSAVLSALEGSGWKVRGNDAGDLFTLSYRSPQTDREFAVVLNMRGRDIDSPGDWIQAARDITMDDSVLWNGGTDRDNQKLVYHDLNRFKDGMRRNLPDVVRQAVMSVVPKGYDANRVRDWYMRTYPDDELGGQVAPSLTFSDALRAVPRGGDFYEVLGVGDSIMRERVFEELATRTGLSYDDIYERWLNHTPWPLAPNLPLGVLDVMYGPAERGELAHGGEPQQTSLRDMERTSRAASEQLSESGDHGPSGRDEQEK